MSDSVDASSGSKRRRKLGKKAETFLPYESFLPDDVVIDILSRVPATDVLGCRCVCKRWRDLTSPIDFIVSHIRRSFSMILKDYNGEAVLDRCWEPGRTRAKIHKIYQPRHHGIVLTHNGLIVAHGFSVLKGSVVHERSFLIYNPIYRDVVKIMVPVEPRDGNVYGVFFHPIMKEYCILWGITLSLKPFRVQYKILNLGSNPKCRDIRNPPKQRCRIPYIRPVLLDKFLYWMVEPHRYYSAFEDNTFNCNIMEYDIGKEEFRVIPCPVPVNVNRFNFNVNLIDIDGVVSLVQVFPSRESVKISIWTLKDDGEQLWTCCNYIISSDVYPGYGMPKAIAFGNGELALQSNGRLYVCNLEQGTYRKFGQKYDYHVTFLSHVMSLVSLKNWKSNMSIVEEDENNNIERGCGKEIQALRQPR